MDRSQADLLATLHNKAVSSTPYINSYASSPATQSYMPTVKEQEGPLSAQMDSLRESIIEAEEDRNHLRNNRSNPRFLLDKFTKAEMPPIHYAHPTTIFDNIDINLIDDWVKLPKGKLLAQPFGADARNLKQHPRIKTLLFAAIVEITNSHDVGVSAPRPKANSYRTPFSFLIYNISEQQAQILLERGTWSSDAITFSVATFSPFCPKYLFSIKGFTTMNETEVANAVNEIWRDQTSLTFLQAICQSFPENFKEQAISTLQQFVNSLEVKKLVTRLPGNTIAPTYNVYANGPLIGNNSIWSKIRMSRVPISL